MLSRFVIPAIVLAASMFSLPARAQDAPRTPFPAPDPGALPVDRSQEKHIDGWYRDVPVPPKDQKASPAPRHDLSGIWEPAAGWRDGVQFLGAMEYPSDGKHILPFTPLGEKAFKANKPGFGTTEVPIALNNDPFDICDPIGFPRIQLFNLRARSEEHTSELQSHLNIVCRLLLEKKKKKRFFVLLSKKKKNKRYSKT